MPHSPSILVGFLFALLSAPLFGQVESAQPPGIGTGVLAAWTGTRDLSAGGEIPLPMPADAALSDFTLSFILELQPGKAADIGVDFMSITDPDSRDVLTILAAPSGRILARLGEVRMDAPAPKISTATVPHHVVINIHRDARQALSGLWIDGIERVSALVPPGTSKLGKALLLENSRHLGGKISDVRLYDRSLTRQEINELTLAAIGASAPTLKPFANTLELQPDEVIAILGGTEANTLADDGSLEALLAHQTPSQRFSVRNLAWEADTVFRQDRPMNFGDLAQQIKRIEATSVLLLFGRQECLDLGETGLDKFREALGKIITACQAQTPRLVFLGLPPFESPDKAKPGDKPKRDLTGENAVLQKYNEALRLIAKDAHALFASAPPPAAPGTQPLTYDGLNISKAGAWQLASSYIALTGNTDPLPKRDDLKDLLTAIQVKNRLWHDYWRPTNWAFLHGDRTAQPSSRDHLDPKIRWFPAEQEKYVQLILEAEQQIHRAASTGLKALP